MISARRLAPCFARRGMTAMSVLMLIPAVLFVALVQRQMMEGLTSGAVKG